MKERMNLDIVEPTIYKAMDAAEKCAAAFRIRKSLVELVKLRTSQLNGCGYCVNLHSLDARKAGETEQRVFGVSAWKEVPFFNEEERTAFQMAEEITNISISGLKDDTYQSALKHFGAQGVAQLIFIITLTNSWNRLAVSMHMVAE